MVWRDSDGSFVSADSVDVSREHHQERISEENVCFCPSLYISSPILLFV